ncbi:MAG: hypothetical protein GY774_10265 [Planctomycetes bacterium]|nr:hypothetical protein [Planctomycetota bacterium]
MKSPLKTSHKHHFAIILFYFYALVLLWVPGPVQALTLPETAKLLPPDTVLMVDVHDLSRLKKQFEETSFYKLYKDPAMAPFFDDLKTKWREKSRTPKEKTIGLFAGVDVFPDGRMAVALILNERLKDAKKPPYVFIIQWKQNINKVKEAVDKAAIKAVEDGEHRKNENYRGAEITTIIRKSSKTYHFCFIEDCLIGTEDMEVLKFVIAQVKGAGSSTLADEADYPATMRAVKLHDAEQINCYISIKQIIKTAINSDTKGKVKTIISNLGLDNVESLGLSFGPGAIPAASSRSSSGKAFLRIRGQKTGVSKVLDIESVPIRTPRFIPNSAYAVSFVNLNIKNAYSELGKILSSFSPQFAAIMYMPLIPASPQGEPPLQIKTGIIDHLGSQIIIAQSINESGSGDDTSGPETSLIAVAIENRQALEKSLSLLHSKIIAANNPNASRQLLGHTMYLIDLQGFLPGLISPSGNPMQNPAGMEIPKMPKFAFTVTDTHLIFSKESAVEKAIRTLNSAQNVTVDSARWFNIAKSAVPSLAGLVTLQNDTASGKYIWSEMRNLTKQIKNKDKDSSIEMGVGVRSGSSFPQMMFSQAGVELLDFSLLPEFDAVKKYFGLLALYGISKPEGFFFEYKYLNPPDID